MPESAEGVSVKIARLAIRLISGPAGSVPAGRSGRVTGCKVGMLCLPLCLAPRNCDLSFHQTRGVSSIASLAARLFRASCK